MFITVPVTTVKMKKQSKCQQRNSHRTWYGRCKMEYYISDLNKKGNPAVIDEP